MAQSYENLKIWRDSILLAENIYKITRRFPKDELFGMVSQMRRAAVSVSSNIAEGSSRQSKKDYSRFIEISIGSLKELENLAYLSHKLGYTDKILNEDLQNQLGNLGQSVGAFRKYLIK